MISFIGFCLVIYCAFYGSYANPLWKRHQESSYYANGLFRAIIGLPAWVAVIYLMMGSLGSFILWAAVTAGCAALSILRMKADGILDVRAIHLLIMASMGSWARVILAWTGIGLLVTTRTKRAAEIGWQGAAMEWMDDNARNNRTSSGPSFAEILAESSSSGGPSYSKPEKEAWYEDEHGNKKRLQLNSDGSMFKDPYTGEWRKLND